MEPRLSHHDEVDVECNRRSYRNSDHTPESEIVRNFPVSVVVDIRKTHHIAASVRCYTKSFNSLWCTANNSPKTKISITSCSKFEVLNPGNVSGASVSIERLIPLHPTDVIIARSINN